MEQNTSLAQIQQRYKDCNLLLPIASEAQINPFYRLTAMEVKADLSDNTGDIFKVGSVRTGENTFEDVFSPAKPLLMKLAAAAGIQFDPNNTYGTFLTKNCYKAKAYGAMRLPDGTFKTHADEKVINLEDEEDRFRLEFMDKSIEGITDWKAAKAAEKMFAGEWIDTGEKNEKNYPIKKYVIADKDRQKYIDRSVLVNMTLLRKTFAEKAMTGAILRTVRALIGMKGQYTKAELAKPFAVARVTFSPDYNDPEVRRAMLEQGLNSMSNMFGSRPALTGAPVHDAEYTAVGDMFNPEEFANNPAFQSDGDGAPLTEDSDQSPPPAHEDEPPAAPPPPVGSGTGLCANCESKISAAVEKFSTEKFGLPLCMKCQKEATPI